MFSRDLTLARYDAELFAAMEQEAQRQEEHIELIASENYTSPAVMEAQGSVLTNKYAEGYPHKRYYGGCEYVDIVEQLAIDRAKQLFGADYANVQPHAGSQANAAVYLALLSAGDTILGMSLAHGGHLTHGASVSSSGKLYNAVQYGIDANGLIDYDEVERLAVEHKPKMIVAGFSAYSQVLDFARFRAIADKVGAYLFVDMAHVAGLVAAGVYPNPVPFADVVTTTTHKTLRGPRGGLILARANEEIEKKLNSAVFPGAQGGPLEHVIAAKAVCFKEALQPEFKTYQQQVLKNAQSMAQVFLDRGFDVVSGGTRTTCSCSPDQAGHHRQRRRRRPRPRVHHREQELGPERPALAVRHLRPAHRYPGRDHPRLQGSRVPRAGRLDLRHPREHGRRVRGRRRTREGQGDLRQVPGLRQLSDKARRKSPANAGLFIPPRKEAPGSVIAGPRHGSPPKPRHPRPAGSAVHADEQLAGVLLQFLARDEGKDVRVMPGHHPAAAVVQGNHAEVARRRADLYRSSLGQQCPRLGREVRLRLREDHASALGEQHPGFVRATDAVPPGADQCVPVHFHAPLASMRLSGLRRCVRSPRGYCPPAGCRQ